MSTKTLIAVSTGVLLAASAAPAMAKDGRAETMSTGNCSSAATWKLKAKERDGAVEVEFEVDSNVVGQTWAFTLSGPGGVLTSGSRTTSAPSGSWSAEVSTSGAVTDAFVGVASFGDIICDTTVSPVWNGSTDDNPSSDDSVEDQSGDDSGRDSTGDDRGKREDSTASGTCANGATVQLRVKRSGKKRVAKLTVDSQQAGEKWEYRISRDGSLVTSGSARTKGKKAVFKAKAVAKGKGAFTAVAERVDGDDECSVST